MSNKNLLYQPLIATTYRRAAGADPGFQVRGGALKKLHRAEGGAKIFGVFRVKDHDFTPKKHIFSNFRGARAGCAPLWIRPWAASLLPPNSVRQQLSTSTGFNNNHRDICDRNCHHLHGLIISLRGEVRAHKTSLTPPLFIEVSVPSQKSERSCICAKGNDFASLWVSSHFWQKLYGKMGFFGDENIG
jgi:hypothetical protein